MTTPSTASTSPAEYTLGAGDEIRVTVFGQPEISGDYIIDASGFIATALVGPIEAQGVTPRQLEQTLSQTMSSRGLLVDPQIAVQVSQFRPYYILGEVGEPGAYPYTPGLTVRNAVAAARGFTYRANTRRVYIQHAGEAEEQLYELTPSTTVGPGDTIRIPERFF